MQLERLLNGAGPLVVLSAPLMLVGLLARIPRFRRAAVFLALALPVVFLIGTGVFVLRSADMTPFDFHVNYQAALGLYQNGESPYSVHAAYSFPFPTFFLYWLAGGFGRLAESQAWVVWWLVNGAIWLACAQIAWRWLPHADSEWGRDVQRYAMVAIPAMTTLWQGQTALLILAGLVGLQTALAQPAKRRLVFIAGGLGLAWAILIKPQLALVGLGLGLWMIARRDPSAWFVVRLIAAAAVVALILIGLTILLPGGVTFDTYRQFVQEALPQVARPTDQLVIGSPAFAAGALALQLGATERATDWITNGVTVLIVILAAVWTFRRAQRPLAEIAAGWGVWAMVTPRVAWMWYATWCLPFFLLAIHETRSGWHLALWVVVLALVNLQVDSLPVAFGTMILLIGLLWTSFRPDFEYTRV